MMVDGCHFKNTAAFPIFFLGVLEPADLNHNRQCLYDINQCQQNKGQMLVGCQADGNNDCTQVHGTGISHKALCRMQIPDQKAQASAGNCHRKQRIRIHLQHVADQCHQQHDHQRNRSTQSIYTVCQVNSIGHIQNHQHHQRIIYKVCIKLNERQINYRTLITQCIHHGQPCNRNHNL